jgi:O-antigen ligase
MKSTLSKWFEKWMPLLVAMVAFIIPIEHKYDKVFRHFSAKLIPDGVSLPPGFDLKIYFYPSDIVMLLLFMSAILIYKSKRQDFFLKEKAPLLWIVFLCAIISICASPLALYPTIYTRLLHLFTPLAVFILITQIPLSEKQIHRIFYAIMIAALVQSLIATAQYFTQESLGLRWLSESRESPAVFQIASGKKWLFDALSNQTIIKRSAGTFPHCNVLGGFLMMSILISYSFFCKGSLKQKYLIGLCIAFQYFALSITYSRSAIFGTILATSVWFGFSLFHRKIHLHRWLIGTIIGSIALSGALFFEQYLFRGGIINYNITSQQSDQIRLDAQHTAIEMIKDHLFTGVGFQQFSKAAAAYGNPVGTHNIYLFLCSEMGLFAFIAFLGFLVSILIQAIKVPFTPEIASLLSIFIAFLFIGGCDFYPILFQQGKLMLFLTAALLVSQTRQSLPPKHSPIIGSS